MVLAIIAALLIIIVAGVALVLFFRARSVKPGGSVPRSISSIGSSTPYQTRKGASMAASAGAHQSSNAPLLDRLRPRFAAMTVVLAAIFGTLGVKLWSMQVLSSEEYQEASDANQLTTVKTSAARGRIYDAEGIVMVDNKTTSVVVANAEVAENRNVLMRLSSLLGVPYAVVRQRVQNSTGGAQALREVSDAPRARDVAFIAEHADAFPGVDVQETTRRQYPYASLAGSVLGYTSAASESELKSPPAGLDYQSGDEVGKAGIEQCYEKYLFGTHGERVVVTDVDGTVHEVRSETPASQGNDVHLTISARVQYVAESQLKSLIAPNGVIGGGKGTSGAVVAMEVDTGNVVAMANFPNFDPTNFVGGISQEDWDRYAALEDNSPLMNFCISGQYPAASTFKAFSGMAGLHYGFADASRSWNCTGSWTGFGEAYAQNCWKLDGHGAVGLREGIVVSCDTVFYEIAKDFYNAGTSGSLPMDAMSTYVQKFGLGHLTGVELSGETAGVIPSPEWKAEAYRDAPLEAQWRPGDMSNMAIGQGNVLVTPLQMAVGYAGVATGKLPRPNLLKEVRNSAGEVVITHTPTLTELDGVEESYLEIIRDGLRGVATEGSEVPNVLKQYDYQCACKTGTGELANHDGYAWFAMYAPYDDPKYVVTCVIKEGGSGGTTAAPIAAAVMDACVKFGDGTLTTEIAPIEEVTDAIEYHGTGDGRVD